MMSFCQNCGKKIESSARFCEHCGANVSTFGDPGKGWVRATAEEPMTHCGKCQRQVALNGPNECPYCGAEINEPTGPQCRNCGTRMQDEVITCVVCGAELSDQQDNSSATHLLSWMIYKNTAGHYGISIVGWIVLTVLAVACMGIYFLYLLITV